jgi:ferric-dicitrate binding protein FerR (iron transport regulator)
MNNLIDKYRKDELTPEELSELRKNMNSMAEAETERQLYASWIDGDINVSSVENSTIDKLKGNIDAVIGRKQSGLSSFIRWTQVAAAILLPVSILFSIYFYRENNLIPPGKMIVTTGKGERTSVSLPDGTIVALNMESQLEYHPQSYNKKERKINFSGEGYFQVYHNKEIPFFINAKGLLVKVLGTTFNLSVREKNDYAELCLEDGCVSLLSTQSNKSVVLRKNQKAVLNYQSAGDIIVTDLKNISDVSAWRRGDMVFRNTELSQVIRTIEENYNITIKIDCKDCLTDRFTGTLPVYNLNEVFEVIEHSYHLKAVIRGNEVVIKP